MKTKYILLVDNNVKNTNSAKYAKERNMPLADTFTSFADDYEGSKKFAEDIVSLEKGVWDKMEIHNLITGEIKLLK